ncbi:MAG: helix-turn-helix transcriptional regulator [Clostridia bacterium]|nr:helix-turn-helix transcriptional regulator [Clostridia bacterium]
MSIQLGTKLADLRKRNGYSQEALAEKMGVSRQAVSKWERGESTPDTDTLIELARLYSVSLDTLVGNEQNEETKESETGKKKKKQKEKKPPLYPGLSKKLLLFPYPILIVVIYILLGFALNLWHPSWLLFLTIPAYYHFAIAARATTKKGLLLGMPVIEAAVFVFLVLGLFMNAWKWAWVLFILAIFYYWSVAFYVKNDK